MTLKVQSARGEAVLPIPQGLYVAGHFQPVASSLCDHVAAFALPSGNLLLILIRDDRPQGDQAVAYLVGPEATSMLAGPVVLGTTGAALTVAQEHGGVRVRVGDGGSDTEPEKFRWINVREAAKSLSIEPH